MRSKAVWIVVAEDNRPDVFLIREALDQAGVSYRLDAFADGDEMLSFIDRLEADMDAPQPDLFLIDLNLPKRSGGEILSRMRNSPRCFAIPVIVISSSNTPKDRELAMTMGARFYFRKPSQLQEFMKIGGHVRAVLEEDRSDI